jgi:hypothetical protein
MIAPTELRIGNIVLAEDGIRPFGIDDFIRCKEGCIMQYGYVLLDTEWLERFGFEKRWPVDNVLHDFNGSIIFQNDCYNIIYVMNNEFNFEISRNTNELGIDVYAKKLKYVHQLQNLFHAITGKELNVLENTHN